MGVEVQAPMVSPDTMGGHSLLPGNESRNSLLDLLRHQPGAGKEDLEYQHDLVRVEV